MLQTFYNTTKTFVIGGCMIGGNILLFIFIFILFYFTCFIIVVTSQERDFSFRVSNFWWDSKDTKVSILVFFLLFLFFYFIYRCCSFRNDSRMILLYWQLPGQYFYFYFIFILFYSYFIVVVSQEWLWDYSSFIFSEILGIQKVRFLFFLLLFIFFFYFI